MSSEWKYRIKCASRPDRISVYRFDSFDDETSKTWVEDKVWDRTDSNILPHTCAYIVKVRDLQGNPQYVCGIKRGSGNYSLKPGKEEDQFQISGAEEFDTSSLDPTSTPDWIYDVFKCRHLDMFTGASVTIDPTSSALDKVVTFPQCNCYVPRGGLAIGFLQGAVRESGSLGIAPTICADPDKTLPHTPADPTKPTSTDQSIYLEWYQVVYKSQQVTPYFMAGLNDDVPIVQKYPKNPQRLSYIFMVMNARALLVPCCYWRRPTPILYDPRMFRVVDKAWAKFNKKTEAVAAAIKGGDIVATPDWKEKVITASQMLDGEGIFGKITEYDLKDPKSKDDYFLTGDTDDDFQKNALLGLHYDFTLPNAGNNQRIVYVIDHDVAADWTGPLYNYNKLGPNCTKDCKTNAKYHFHAKNGFRPENCGYPDLDTRYTWGCTCNGGGAYSLDTGQACPYYRNGLIGDKDSPEWDIKLQNLYAGDSITAGQILQLMWLTGGGWPWDEAAWNKEWKYPIIWSTVPLNPVLRIADKTIAADGSMKDVEPYYEHRLAAQKTTVDLATGKIKQEAPKILTGGTQVFWKTDSTGTTTQGDQEPSFPNIIQYLEFKATTPLQIVWPRSLFSTENMDLGNPSDYQAYLQKYTSDLKDTYNKYHWTPDGMTTSVMVSTNGGYYPSGLICINTAFLLGDWAKRRDELLQAVQDPKSVLDATNQKLLKDFYGDLITSLRVGGTPMLADSVYRASPKDFGFTVFDNVKLNTLVDQNGILIIGFKYQGKIGAALVKVRSMFRHGYLVQKDGCLHTSWFPYWDGRPSYFLGGDTPAWYEKAFDKTYQANSTTNISIMEDSGKVIFSSFAINRDGKEQKDILPYKIWRPNASAYAKVKDCRKKSVDYNSDLGDWHPLGVCGGYVVLRLDSTKFNAHNERMIYGLEGEEQPKKDGEQPRKLQFLPIMYAQIDRPYPGDSKDTAVKNTEGDFVKVMKPDDPLDLAEGPLHPWIIIARAVAVPDKKTIQEWRTYKDQIFPEPTWSTEIFDYTKTTLKIKYAYIDSYVERVSSDKRVQSKTPLSTRTVTDDDSQLTYRLENETDTQVGGFRHANYKCIFKCAAAGNIDGKDTIVHGAKCQTALWPYARFTCRDIEVSYIWDNEYDCKDCQDQSTGEQRFRAIAQGDHDFHPWTDCFDNIILKDDGPDGKNGSVWAQIIVPYWTARFVNDKNFNQSSCNYRRTYWGIERGYGTVNGPFGGPRYYPYTRYNWGTVAASNNPCFGLDFWKVYTNKQDRVGIERLLGLPERWGSMKGCIIKNKDSDKYAGWSRPRGPSYDNEILLIDPPTMSPSNFRGRLPLFGNMGRDAFFLDIVTLGQGPCGEFPPGYENTSWPGTPQGKICNPKATGNPGSEGVVFPVYSHYGSNGPSQPIYKSTNMFRTIECEISRMIKPLTFGSQNPYYTYLFDMGIWSETADLPETNGSDQSGLVQAAEVRWVNKYMGKQIPPIMEKKDSSGNPSGEEPDRARVDYARLQKYHFYFDQPEYYTEFYALPYNPPFVTGKHFHSMRSVGANTGGEISKQPSWVWPTSNTDKLTRNIKLLVQKVDDKGKLTYDVYPDRGLSAINSISLPPYTMTGSLSDAKDDGRDISLGPQLDEDVEKNTNDKDKQEKYYKETYYMLITTSERIEGGKYRDAEIGISKLDNADVKGIKDPVCSYIVSADGTITPKNHSYVNTTDNLKLGAAPIVSQITKVMPWQFYPGFNLKYIQAQYLGKNLELKTYKKDDFESTYLEKQPGGERSSFHKIHALFKSARQIVGDMLSAKITYNFDPKALSVTSVLVLFKAISLRKDTAGDVLLASSEIAMPFEDTDNKIITYDLGFDFCYQLDMEFYFTINQTLEDFNKEETWGVDQNKADLSNVISSIELTYLYPGKAAEIVKIEPVKLLVSNSNASERKGIKYNFFDFKSDWVLPKYMVPTPIINQAYCMSKPKQAWYFFVCPELPITKYNCKDGNPDSTPPSGCTVIDIMEKDEWMRGGAWVTHPAGQEQYGVFPPKVFDETTDTLTLKMSATWWPAMPYNDGKLIMKGRAWLHGDQYKDEFNVTKSDRAAAKDPEYAYNTDAFWVRQQSYYYPDAPDNVTADKVAELEGHQQKIYEEIITKVKDNNLDGTVKFKAIIPRNDIYYIIHTICGADLKKQFPTLNVEVDVPSISDFNKLKKDCILRYKVWTWEDVDTFTFGHEGADRVTALTRVKSFSYACRLCKYYQGAPVFIGALPPIISEGFDFTGYDRDVWRYDIDSLQCESDGSDPCQQKCSSGLKEDIWDQKGYWKTGNNVYLDDGTPEPCSEYTPRITTELTKLLKKEPDKPLKF